MTPLTREWVNKAENDFNSAKRLSLARKMPDFDGSCFHAQQCAETSSLVRSLVRAALGLPI